MRVVWKSTSASMRSRRASSVCRFTTMSSRRPISPARCDFKDNCSLSASVGSTEPLRRCTLCLRLCRRYQSTRTWLSRSRRAASRSICACVRSVDAWPMAASLRRKTGRGRDTDSVVRRSRASMLPSRPTLTPTVTSGYRPARSSPSLERALSTRAVSDRSRGCEDAVASRSSTFGRPASRPRSRSPVTLGRMRLAACIATPSSAAASSRCSCSMASWLCARSDSTAAKLASSLVSSPAALRF
mmetsp:Transcript_12841/g.29953  ORF Transcript_12841/g.29953 Transcript_12841/m.29953 type:complete len:243 (+) Transcript_12841:2679-3407(+)